FFFFSIRRRHTRCYRDWSSDVCSSDLVPSSASVACSVSHSAPSMGTLPGLAPFRASGELVPSLGRSGVNRQPLPQFAPVAAEERSEERRVGKECRSRWSPWH